MSAVEPYGVKGRIEKSQGDTKKFIKAGLPVHNWCYNTKIFHGNLCEPRPHFNERRSGAGGLQTETEWQLDP